MKPEYLEPWKQKYPTKTDLLTAWSDWFESKSDEWNLFTLTVVYKAGGKVSRPDRWESEYKNRVLLKIKRSLERNKKNFDFAIPFEDFCYYEFEESSIFRVTGARKPHHIHALIPIRKSATYRFWSVDDDDLQKRLKKDINSINSIGSILVKPIDVNHMRSWISYCLKGKQV